MATNTASTAAHAVGTTPELVELILLRMSADNTVKSIRVCSQSREIIQHPGSKKLQEAMFMAAEKSLGDLDLERWYLDTSIVHDANAKSDSDPSREGVVRPPSDFVCISELSPEETAYLVNNRQIGIAYPADNRDIIANTVTPVRLNPILPDVYGYGEFAVHGWSAMQQFNASS